MKKIILILLLTVFASSAFAQVGREIIQGGSRSIATQSSIALKVAQKVEQGIVHENPTIALAQITNWVGKPTIRVQLTGEELAMARSLNAQPIEARVLDWKTASQYILPAGRYGHKAYIPTPFGQQQGKAFFRGLPLRRLDELKNLLDNGLEVSKVTSYFPGIFATTDVPLALDFSVPWGALYPSLPVMVRMPDTPELWEKNPLDWKSHFDGVFHQDINPQFMSHIAVFLEVNKKPGWYNVVSVDNEMVLIPVSGTPIAW